VYQILTLEAALCRQQSFSNRHVLFITADMENLMELAKNWVAFLIIMRIVVVVGVLALIIKAIVSLKKLHDSNRSRGQHKPNPPLHPSIHARLKALRKMV
jgi:uncharacterized membrane protein YhaH (DUF805 family)